MKIVQVRLATGTDLVEMELDEWRIWYNKTYLSNDHWKRKRGEALEWSRGWCLVCGKRKAANIHHNKQGYLNLWQEELWMILALCANCHRKFHNLLQPKIRIVGRSVANVDVVRLASLINGRYKRGLIIESDKKFDNSNFMDLVVIRDKKLKEINN